MQYVQAVVEDVLQEAVLVKLLSHYRSDITIVGISGKRGNSYIKQGIKGFNEAAPYLPHIVITDLDQHQCAPVMLQKWMPFKLHQNLLFRIAEKEIEAWLMADRNTFAQFLGVPVASIPLNTQTLQDPKLHIINLAKKSKKKAVKDLVPIGSATQGPGYNVILENFVHNYWDPERSQQNNVSLYKAISKIKSYLK